MLLSLLISTIRSRAAMLERLLARLDPQLIEGVELLTAIDDGECPIGQKRNRLLHEANGDYVAFIDDDDLVSDDYVCRIMTALASKPDCVGFKVRRFSDSKKQGIAIHRLSAKEYWTQEVGNKPPIFWRTPNHLNPIRADLAKQVGFKPVNFAEDRDYSQRLFPLLKTEVFIDAFLYEYHYRNPLSRVREKTNEQHPAVRVMGRVMAMQ